MMFEMACDACTCEIIVKTKSSSGFKEEEETHHLRRRGDLARAKVAIQLIDREVDGALERPRRVA